jgi:hypothetical protein
VLVQSGRLAGIGEDGRFQRSRRSRGASVLMRAVPFAKAVVGLWSAPWGSSAIRSALYQKGQMVTR